MKQLSIKLIFALLAVVISGSAVSAQITSTQSGGRTSSKPEQAVQAEEKVKKVAQDSGRYFKQGLYNLQDNRRSRAREDFDKAVEVFLMSGINVQKNDRLRECYNQLIETVYRMEYPSGQRPVKGQPLRLGSS